MAKIYIANQAVNEFTYVFLINKELWKLAVVFFYYYYPYSTGAECIDKKTEFGE